MTIHSNSSNREKDLTSIFGPTIYAYTRSQAIADGNLVDVSETAAEAGWRYPVAVTVSLWQVIETIPRNHSYQSSKGRLLDVLYMAMQTARRSQGSRFVFELNLFREGSRKKFCQLVADCGPGDEGEPVVTIGFSEDF